MRLGWTDAQATPRETIGMRAERRATSQPSHPCMPTWNGGISLKSRILPRRQSRRKRFENSSFVAALTQPREGRARVCAVRQRPRTDGHQRRIDFLCAPRKHSKSGSSRKTVGKKSVSHDQAKEVGLRKIEALLDEAVDIGNANLVGFDRRAESDLRSIGAESVRESPLGRSCGR